MDIDAVDRAKSWLEVQAHAASAVAQTIKETAMEKVEKLHHPETTPGGSVEKAKKEDGDDIDKSELMTLCMKMNKKIKSLDAKLTESDATSASLLNERRDIVSSIKAWVPLTIPVPSTSLLTTPTADGDSFSRLDIEKLQAGLEAWIQMQEKEKKDMIDRVSFIGNSGGVETNSGDSGRMLALKEAEMKSLEDKISFLQNTLAEQEASFTFDRNNLIERNNSLQQSVLQQKGDLARLERMKTDFESANEKLARMTVELEEKELAEANQKEMLRFLQNRLNEIDAEYAKLLDEKKGFSSQLSSHQVLKAEQEALLSSLRGSLQQALDSNSELEAEVVTLRVFKEKNTDKTEAFNSLSEESDGLRDLVEEQQALITRLRQEAEKSSQNHAMRTAILASTESDFDKTKKELKSKEDEISTYVEKIKSLTFERKREAEKHGSITSKLESHIVEMERDQEALQQDSNERVIRFKKASELDLEKAQKDFNKKSGMARQLLQEKEEDIRLLNEKIEVLSAEIRSGAPSERRIFEIAQKQAKREHIHSVKLDTREMAFQQLQEKLSLKDLQLAQLQTANSNLRTEVAQLSRVAKREGVNMDYLKDVVLKFITFPVQSPEKTSLVPVIAMLLQFSPEEVKEASTAVANPIWSRTEAIEVDIEALRARSAD